VGTPDPPPPGWVPAGPPRVLKRSLGGRLCGGWPLPGAEGGALVFVRALLFGVKFLTEQCDWPVFERGDVRHA